MGVGVGCGADESKPGSSWLVDNRWLKAMGKRERETEKRGEFSTGADRYVRREENTHRISGCFSLLPDDLSTAAPSHTQPE